MQEKVENLKPEECLILIEKMNRKRFLNRQIFVTSVVADSPIKQPPAQHLPETGTTTPPPPTQQYSSTAPVPKPNISQPKVPDLGKPLSAKPAVTIDLSGADSKQENNLDKDFVFGPPSPGVQEKIDVLEKQKSSSKLLVTPLPTKRKSESSPEKSSKEKKLIRSAEKKKLKQEAKNNKTLKL